MHRFDPSHLALSLLLATGFAFAFTGCGEVPEEEPSSGACQSDNDCKGDRICENNACVSPTATQNNSTPQNNSTSQNNASMNPPAGAFGAACSEDMDCDGELCVFKGDSSNGFCSSYCDAVSDCPDNYDCIFIGGASRKTCVPEDRLTACQNHCQAFGDFECTTRVADCMQACQGASVEARKSFANCGDPTGCEQESCFEALAPGQGSWLTPDAPTCDRSNTESCAPVDKEYSCAEGEETPIEGCFRMGTNPENGEDIYCCFEG